MNVLGKIKSKKQQNTTNTQNTQISQILNKKEIEEPPLTSIDNNNDLEEPEKCYESQHLQVKKEANKKTDEKKTAFRPMKPILEEADYITNTNVLSKQKESILKGKESHLKMTAVNSPSTTSYFSTFQTHKPSKNQNNNNSSGVYFDSNSHNNNRSSTFFIDSNTNTNQCPKNKRTDSYESEEEMTNLEFDFLLSNKEKKEAKKSIHLSKGKLENEREIETELKGENEEVLCFYLKKSTIYGDIFMLEGEIESLKRGYILIDLHETRRKVNTKMKIKLSCGRDILTSLETISRIYLSEISFLSETEAMIIHEYVLRVIEKNRKFNK